jgi:hypothetical protein
MEQPQPYPATDYTKVRTLPREIVFPTAKTFEEAYSQFDRTAYVGHIVGLAKGLEHDVWRLPGQEPAPPYERSMPAVKVDPSGKTIVRESEDLKILEWSSFQILVDGTLVVIDFNDGHNFSPLSFKYPHWLRFRFHSNCKCYPQLGALTMTTFGDWARYDELQRQARAERNMRKNRTIICNQWISPYRDRNVRRRLMVRGMLYQRFGDRVDMTMVPQDKFHQKAASALCYVSVPGDWENQMARGQLQMIGLGVPTISPIMYEQCCDGLLQPGIHYLACRQDFMDVPDLIKWCETHPDELTAMSHNAWLFFQEFCTPIAVWSHVKDRLESGPRHWRADINDDLSPPCLYVPSQEVVPHA